MRNANPASIRLEDYRPPAYLLEGTGLHFELHEEFTLVHSALRFSRNAQGPGGPLRLDGEALELLALRLDGRKLAADEYRLTETGLELEAPADTFLLECTTRIDPAANTTLSGLYRSREMYCTQCEAHGFRRITFYPDRPDVLSVFSVRVDADRQRYPVLLSNGNLVDTQDLGGGRHSARWHDPFPKPCYLFALVAGDLRHVESRFQTCSGRDVCLRLYVEEKDLGKCAHAMASLERAMRWDEEVYGREYDLDIFNIVAVDDFNLGAMENKSLNLFNSSCVLCSPQTTTDAGFQGIEGIVAHEYFHNWSGNRVTCRDWFQLSLKEGFTVFRDASFSADMGSATVRRVEEVRFLRTVQFAEDAGPMAHPVRPEAVIEINNFYTATVYEKGAEVVRMIHTLLGAEKFRRGTDLYFDRHDGQAVTCEDFVRAMEEAGGIDLGNFRRWYSQAGTPLLTVRDEYDAERCEYTLHVSQTCPPTPGQPVKQPFVIPLAMGLLGDAGNLPLRLAGSEPDTETPDNTHCVLVVDQASQQFVFEAVPERPVPSLLRGFSAPVRLDYPYSRDDLYALMTGDDDGFVRWDSAQALATGVIRDAGRRLREGADPQPDELLVDAFRGLLGDTSLDPAMVAEMLVLPGEDYLAELAAHDGGADVDNIHAARERVKRDLANACTAELLDCYRRLEIKAEYEPSPEQIAARSLRNVCLAYLACAPGLHPELAERQFAGARNMTDRLASLRLIVFHGADDARENALQRFLDDWRHDALVMNQWFAVQAAMPQGDTLARVRSLLTHPAYDRRNPNKVRALVGGFSHNPVQFHRIDGAGYRFLADQVVEADAVNPQLASRLLEPLTQWRKYRGREALMRDQLERLAALPDLSADVFELVSKSLGEDGNAG